MSDQVMTAYVRVKMSTGDGGHYDEDRRVGTVRRTKDPSTGDSILLLEYDFPVAVKRVILKPVQKVTHEPNKGASA